MLPNRFADAGETPEFNAVDASLWFVVAVRELVDAADAGKAALPVADRERLLVAVTAILEGYAAGTRYGIRLDEDGLLACGVPGVQLTWMDAKVGDWVVTPRIGKPVEVQALWLSALAFASRWDARWQVAYARGRVNFADKFWNPDGQFLYDVVDVDHVSGRVDPAFRPNQIFAVGGLGDSLLDPDRTRWSSTRSSAVCSRRSVFGRWRPASRATRRTTRRPARARRRVSPGHGLAVAARSLRRGVARRVARTPTRRVGRRGSGSSRRCWRIWTRPDWDTSARSRTPTRRSRRAGVPSRRGRWESCCGFRRWSAANGRLKTASGHCAGGSAPARSPETPGSVRRGRCARAPRALARRAARRSRRSR